MLEMHFEANFRVLFQGFDKWAIIPQKAQSILTKSQSVSMTPLVFTLICKTPMKLLETISTWAPLSRLVISDVYTLNIVFGRLKIRTFENIFVSILYLFEFELYDISSFRYMKPFYSFLLLT